MLGGWPCFPSEAHRTLEHRRQAPTHSDQHNILSSPTVLISWGRSHSLQISFTKGNSLQILSSPPVSPLFLTKEPGGSFQSANLILLPHTGKSLIGSCQCQDRTHPTWHSFSTIFPSSALSPPLQFIVNVIGCVWSTMEASPLECRSAEVLPGVTWLNGQNLILENNYCTNQWYQIKLTIQSKFVSIFVF